MMDRPLLPDVGVLGLVPDRWDAVWQSRHHIFTRLAQYFHVVWLNPPHSWRDLMARRPVFTPKGDPAQLRGLAIYTPELWLPKFHRPGWLDQLTFDLRVKRARRLLTNRGCRQIILYIWRPNFERALQSVPYDLSCYHIDDEYTFSRVDLPVDGVEKRLIRGADQVFIHSPALLEKKGDINPRTEFVPNGVDYAAYSSPTREPSDLAAIPHPRIGYTGRLKRQLDWPLLFYLVKRHPHWQFVFVGAQAPHTEVKSAYQKLAGRAHVHFLGAKSVLELAAYPQHFDVCVMPYRRDDYTHYIYPMKLHEYLASGKPVVGTRIPSFEEFGDVVKLSSTAGEWCEALVEALEPQANHPEQRRARQAVAQQHDWGLLVNRIAQLMAKNLGFDLAGRVKNRSLRNAITRGFRSTVQVVEE